jgi:hypothetical protein
VPLRASTAGGRRGEDAVTGSICSLGRPGRRAGSMAAVYGLSRLGLWYLLPEARRDLTGEARLADRAPLGVSIGVHALLW